MHQDCVSMARYVCVKEYGFERIFLLCLESGSNSEPLSPLCLEIFSGRNRKQGQSRITRETPYTTTTTIHITIYLLYSER